MDPSPAWGLPWDLEVPRQPHGWDRSRRQPQAPHSTSKFYPEFASCACVPVWRFRFHREATWLSGRREGCELESHILPDTAFSAEFDF